MRKVMRQNKETNLKVISLRADACTLEIVGTSLHLLLQIINLGIFLKTLSDKFRSKVLDDEHNYQC